MKKIARLTQSEFIISGEVNERLPLYQNNLQSVFPLDYDARSTSHDYITTNKSFDGTTSISIDKSLLADVEYEIEIKFRIREHVGNLITCKSNQPNRRNNELVISLEDKVCAYMENGIGKYTTAPDLNPIGKYSICNNLELNKWHTLNLTRSTDIIAWHINNELTRSMIYQGGIEVDSILLGERFKGDVEYIKITSQKERPSTNNVYIINPNITSNSFTVCYNWTPDIIGNYDVVQINNLKAVSNGNSLNILNGSTVVSTTDVREDNEYHISYSYSNNQINILVYNMTTHKILAFNTVNMNLSSISDFRVIDNNTVSKLCLYRVNLDRNKMLRNCKKLFALNKNGDILYEVSEESLPLRTKLRYQNNRLLSHVDIKESNL